MAGVPEDYEVDHRGHVHRGDAPTVLTGLDANASDRALFYGLVSLPHLIGGLPRRVRIGGVLVYTNLCNSRNRRTPECCQDWPPLSGAGPA
jgi:hypothetical protein